MKRRRKLHKDALLIKHHPSDCCWSLSLELSEVHISSALCLCSAFVVIRFDQISFVHTGSSCLTTGLCSFSICNAAPVHTWPLLPLLFSDSLLKSPLSKTSATDGSKSERASLRRLPLDGCMDEVGIIPNTKHGVGNPQ